jgi:patatin-like phospholipase/acyl hydrolase
MGYIDGGVMANNPSMAALTQALDSRSEIPDKPTLDDIRLLSVGTGRPPNGINMKNRKYLDWGFVQWGKYLLDIIMDGSMGTAHYQCEQLLGEEHYQRLNPVLVDAIGLDACDKTDEMEFIGLTYPLEGHIEWLKKSWM